MSDGNDAALIGVAGTLLGGVVGSVVAYVLSERAAVNRENRAEKRLHESVRLLVSTEVDQQLETFRNYWDQVAGTEGLREFRLTFGKREPEAHESTPFWARRLVNTVPPPWSNTSWVSLQATLSPALVPHEIEAVSRIHNNLRTFGILRAELVGPSNEQTRVETRHDLHGRPVDRTVYSFHFEHVSARIWPRCEALAREILETGNPLCKDGAS